MVAKNFVWLNSIVIAQLTILLLQLDAGIWQMPALLEQKITYWERSPIDFYGHKVHF